MLFDFSDPSDYLRHYIDGKRGIITGAQSRLAEAANCQPAYLSQILKGQASLSPEQAESISRFIGHSPKEADYFILLVHLKRAGTPALKAYYQKKTEELRAQAQSLRNRIEEKQLPSLEVSDAFLQQYYQSWLVGAVHVALGCEELKTLKSLSAYFRSSESKISEILGFLEEAGLAIKKSNRWESRPFVYHLDKTSPHFQNHLRNALMCALNSYDKKNLDSDFSYSAYMTLSKESARQIRNILSQNTAQILHEAKDSRDESVYLLSTAFLELGLDPSTHSNH